MSAFVYIAGPYHADTLEERAENVRRVGVLSRHAVALGLVPVSVHAAVEAGHFGRDDVPEDRAAGLWASTQLAAGIARLGGLLWVIRRDDGSLSEGTQREVQAFMAVAPDGMYCPGAPWGEWSKIIGKHP